jgi:hypothetical protein
MGFAGFDDTTANDYAIAVVNFAVANPGPMSISRLRPREHHVHSGLFSRSLKSS